MKTEKAEILKATSMLRSWMIWKKRIQKSISKSSFITAFKSYLKGNLGRSFHAIVLMNDRLVQIDSIQNEISDFLDK